MTRFLLGGLFAIAFTAASFISGCSSDSSSSSTAVVNSYGGPGSEYKMSLNSDGTFQVQVYDDVGGTLQLTVNGTYQSLDSGFVYLTVSSSTGSDGPSAGDTAYGIEIPGMVFLLKPVGGDGEIIPMVSSGSCPTSDFTANWVITNTDGNNADTTDSFGTFSYTASTSAATIPIKHRLSDYSQVGSNDSLGSGSCSSGIMTVGTSPNQATMWLTNTGGAVVRTSGGVIIGMPQSSISLGDLAGTYSGVVFDENTGGDANTPVQVTIASGGASGSAKAFSDVESGTLESGTAATLTLSNANTPENGFFRATLDDGTNPTSNMICTATLDANDSGKNTIFCAGLDGADNSKLWSVVLVEQ